MPIDRTTSSTRNRAIAAAAWVLRVVIAVQVIGLACKYLFATYEVESHIFGVFLFDWGWPEPTAQQVDDYAAWLGLAAGCLLLLGGLAAGAIRRTRDASLRPAQFDRFALFWQGGFAAYVLLWQLALSASQMHRGDVYTQWTFGEHAVRWAAPLALLLFMPLPRRESVSPARAAAAEWLLRIAAAATFAVHGGKALDHYSHFVDLILNSAGNWLGAAPPVDSVYTALTVIGAIDIVIAAMILVCRCRTAAAYMALWGFITAASRFTAMGWENGHPETLLRAANGGVPLALLVYWMLLRRRAVASPSDHSTHREEQAHANV